MDLNFNKLNTKLESRNIYLYSINNRRPNYDKLQDTRTYYIHNIGECVQSGSPIFNLTFLPCWDSHQTGTVCELEQTFQKSVLHTLMKSLQKEFSLNDKKLSMTNLNQKIMQAWKGRVVLSRVFSVSQCCSCPAFMHSCLCSKGRKGFK